MRNNQPVTQREKKFAAEQRLISTTDRKGVIRYVNDDFAAISGFSADELIGSAHNLVRHPDVPSAVFAHMWTDLHAGRSWMGIVKNRCKNGDHYWVNAFVTPIRENGQITGYESVRVKPTADQIARATRLYQRINKGKKAIPADWQGLLGDLLPMLAVGGCGATAGLLFGGWGIAASLLVSAPAALAWRGWQNHRLRHLSEQAAQSINDPLLAQMYSPYRGTLAQLEMVLLSQQARLRTSLTRLLDSAGQLRHQATEASQLALDSSHGLSQQRQQTEQVASAVNEMASTTQEVSGNVQQAAEHTRHARDLASEGKRVTADTRQAIEALSSAVNSAADVAQQLASDAHEIGTVVDVIKGIAEQTNLLALNAAIEAARAGEQGRGFAVVADEVRALASRTADSTEQIHRLIANLQDAAEKAVSAMQQGHERADQGLQRVVAADEALDGITQAIEQINAMTSQIANAAGQQSAVAEAINESVTNIANLAESTSGKAQRSADLSIELADTATHQAELVERFNR